MPLGVSIFILFPYHWTSQALVYSPQQCVSVSVQSVMKSWNMKVVLKAVLTTLWSLLHGFLSLLLWCCGWNLSDSSASISSASLCDRREKDWYVVVFTVHTALEGWKYICFFPHSHCSLVYNMLSGRIPPIRSLWKLLCQSSGLIKCIYFLIHFTCWGKSTGAHGIFIHLPQEVLFSHCAQNIAISALLCADWPVPILREFMSHLKSSGALNKTTACGYII